MIDLFLSYNRQDQAPVLDIRRLLELRGIRTFVDRDQLPEGLPWPQALERSLLSARGVAVFLGPHEFGLWQKREMFFALDLQVQAERESRHFPVIPVLLQGAQPRPGFLFLNTWVDLRNGAEAEAIGALVRAVERDERSPERSAPDICPYLGLRAFREEDHAFYFGREAFIELLVEKVGHQKLLAVVGPSGSGKSSVVRAGLLPRLRRQRPPLPTWDAISFTPGGDPWWRFAHALVPLLQPELSEAQRIEQAGVLTEGLLKRNGALAGTFARVLERSRGTDRLLVIVDQFEEMFTLAPVGGDLKDERAQKEAEQQAEKRAWFLEDLLASPQSTPVSVVLTLRADYYGRALDAHSRALTNLLNTGQVALGPMVREELSEAVTGPAGRVGLRFDAGLVNTILNEVGREPGSLPLLEYALTQLWEKRRGDTLTSEAYDSFKGVTGAIGDKAEGVYKAFSNEEKNACRILFGRLVRVSPADTEGADTRRRATREEIGEAAWQIALKLVEPDVRLLVIGNDLQSGKETAEVAHEALIRRWDRLRGWLREDRAFLLWRQQLEVFLSIWATSGKKGDEALLRGPALEQALKWRKLKDYDLNTSERQFISASNSAQDRVDQYRIWGRRIAETIAIVSFIGGLAWFGYAQTDSYQINRVLADAPWRSVSESSDDQSRAAIRRYFGTLGDIRPDEALLAAQEIRLPPIEADALSSIAQAQANAGQFTEAVSTAQKIPHPDSQASALSIIAATQVKAGQFVEALSTAQKIPNPNFRARALSSIAQAQANTGHFAEALSTAQKIEEPDSEAQALSFIAEAQAKAGQSAEALSTAQKIHDPNSQASALSSIAIAQAKPGHFADALSTAQKIQDPDLQASALSSIAMRQAKPGQFADALSTAQKIQDPNSEADALAFIATAQAHAGQFAEALSTVRQIHNPFFRVEALRSVAEAQARAGQFADALSTGQETRDPNSQARVLIEIAIARVKGGQSAEAVRTAQKIHDPDWQAQALRFIAQAQAEAGQVAEALNTAQAIRDPFSEAKALSSIAQARAKARHFADALSAAERIPDPNYKARTLLSIAEAQATAGQFAEALSTAKEIQDRDSEAHALNSIAQAQANAGRFADALSIAKKVNEPAVQVETLGSIAEAQAKASRFAEALSTAKRIPNGADRSAALLPVAAAEAKTRRWNEARNTLNYCLDRDRLSGYAVILAEYAKANNPKLAQVLNQ
jgi:tetratricopeptide (TPR) repeat protein